MTRILLHGTGKAEAAAIMREGFVTEMERDDDLEFSATLGNGVYLTCLPEVARSFGRTIVEAEIPSDLKLCPEHQIDPSLDYVGGAKLEAALRAQGWEGVEIGADDDEWHEVCVWDPSKVRPLRVLGPHEVPRLAAVAVCAAEPFPALGAPGG